MADTTITPVSSADGKGGNNSSSSRLPGDVNERKFLDSLDDKKGGKDDSDSDPEEKAENLDEEEEADSGDEEESNEDDTEGTGEEEQEEGEDGQEEDQDDDDAELNLDDADEDTSLYQRLKTADKNIFKKIPGLRNVLFREQEFTKRFASIEEAEESKKLADTFIHFQEDIEKGDAETFVDAINELGNEPLLEFSGNFLPALFKKNQDAYYSIMAPEIKKVLRAAGKSDNEHIRNSAKNLNQFLFNNTDLDKDEGFKPKGKEEKKPTERETKADELEKKLYHSFAQDTTQIATRKLKKLISNSLKGFDMSERTISYLVNDIFEQTTNSLDKDVRHKGKMDLLWKNARTNGFTSEGKERLINAFLSRAKEAVPKYRQKVLAENKLAKSAGTGDKKKNPVRIPSSGSSGNNGRIQGKVDPKKIDWNKTTERDMLDGKVTYKK